MSSNVLHLLATHTGFTAIFVIALALVLLKLAREFMAAIWFALHHRAAAVRPLASDALSRELERAAIH